LLAVVTGGAEILRVSGWSLMGKFELGQAMMWIALLSRLGIIMDRQASWMVAAAVRAPLVPRKRRERVISGC
jgi:hypothetical protein